MNLLFDRLSQSTREVGGRRAHRRAAFHGDRLTAEYPCCAVTCVKWCAVSNWLVCPKPFLHRVQFLLFLVLLLVLRLLMCPTVNARKSACNYPNFRTKSLPCYPVANTNLGERHVVCLSTRRTPGCTHWKKSLSSPDGRPRAGRSPSTPPECSARFASCASPASPPPRPPPPAFLHLDGEDVLPLRVGVSFPSSALDLLSPLDASSAWLLPVMS